VKLLRSLHICMAQVQHLAVGNKEGSKNVACIIIYLIRIPHGTVEWIDQDQEREEKGKSGITRS
jgi:hypothetical protein